MRVGLVSLSGPSIVVSTLAWLTMLVLFADLALLAISALISNTFSLVQQGNDIANYVDVVTTQFEIIKKSPNDPELAIAGGSFGVDLVLYYIRMKHCRSRSACTMLTLAFRILFLQCASHAGHVLVRLKRHCARLVLHLIKISQQGS